MKWLANYWQLLCIFGIREERTMHSVQAFTGSSLNQIKPHRPIGLHIVNAEASASYFPTSIRQITDHEVTTCDSSLEVVRGVRSVRGSLLDVLQDLDFPDLPDLPVLHGFAIFVLAADTWDMWQGFIFYFLDFLTRALDFTLKKNVFGAFGDGFCIHTITCLFLYC